MRLQCVLGISRVGTTLVEANTTRTALTESAEMNTPRVSWGNSFPWQSHTELKVRRPGELSVAGSRGTPQITGVACGAETRHSEKANPSGVSGNAGAAGRGLDLV